MYTVRGMIKNPLLTQLHSAAEAECDYFLTSDKKLLAMKFFGKTRIVSTLGSA